MNAVACGRCRLTRALQTFELRTTYEDVLPVESVSVQEYLEQLHDMTTLAAIQVRGHYTSGISLQ